ncbi:hypothetical protein GCM10010218_32590 [Streptomyces mashuensis]|uniref:Histidine kinase/HSP90-like ATPase domain-containing protein n=1 Tax=Streptomyces mashuensis TaxID=33904 RepID=A0A919ECD0_9ACTN|nr:ATP-binding protein [Streptomyces mashuensis]GHF48588.1 hypothetical protein GCM10010218_32590 [Streptomyces mashuensis]
MNPTPHCSLVFPPHPAWVRAAREVVRTVLVAARRTDLADSAVALTSETVTNAVNACTRNRCCAPVTLVAEWSAPGRLRVFVYDAAAGVPERREAVGVEAEAGRGLMLVERGAEAWGVCTHGPGQGKATWFVVGDRPAGRANPRKSPVGCTDCATLEGARRWAVAEGDHERIVDATVAVRSHFRNEHILPRLTW